MSEKYIHDAVVRAWLDGKPVQFMPDQPVKVWVDVEPPRLVTSELPHFHAHLHYRVKPATVRYRVALMQVIGEGSYYVEAASPSTERATAAFPSFVRWLTDWIEAEL